MSETITLEKPNKIYGLKTTTQNMIMIAAGLCIVAAIVVSSAALSGAIILLVISFLNKRLEAVRIYDDYTEIKLAPAAPRLMLKNSSITNVIAEPKHLTLYFTENGKEKSKKIHLSLFSDENKNELTEYYKALV